MKTTALKGLWPLIILALLAFTTDLIHCQDSEPVQTLFNRGGRPFFWWSPGVSFNSVQGELGSLINLSGGIMLNNSSRAGLAGGVNLGHPSVNYGYFGLVGQYVNKPDKLVHLAGQVVLAWGSTKDYENEKSNVFDNFWNVYGEGFYLLEPGINLEVNLTEKLRFSLGLSYRFVTGLDDESPFVSYTHVTNKDMSGLNIRVAILSAGK